MRTTKVSALPSALDDDTVRSRLAGRRPAVFLDYDGVLTPIVDRPEEAVLSEPMRATVRALAERHPVCIITGRDRAVVQHLMGVDDLAVAGSHGFDIWTPQHGSISSDRIDAHAELIATVTERLREAVGTLPGVQVEPKRASVAVHFRLAAPEDARRVGEAVQQLLEQFGDELALTPGKMVYELKPNIDWHKGKAVLHLIEVLGLDGDDVVPLYLGDDITDEDAFRALQEHGNGIGIFVGHPDDPEVADRDTAAQFLLHSVDDVQRFLTELAR